MKTLYKLLPLLLIPLLLLCSCAPKPQVFTEGGVQITLDDSFWNDPTDGFDFAYGSERIMVMGTKDTKAELVSAGMMVEDTTGPEELLQFVIKQNKLEDSALQSQRDGIHYISYTATPEDVTFRYFAAAFRNGDAFWLIQFACRENEYAKNEDTFLAWAKTVTFV